MADSEYETFRLDPNFINDWTKQDISKCIYYFKRTTRKRFTKMFILLFSSDIILLI